VRAIGIFSPTHNPHLPYNHVKSKGLYVFLWKILCPTESRNKYEVEMADISMNHNMSLDELTQSEIEDATDRARRIRVYRIPKEYEWIDPSTLEIYDRRSWDTILDWIQKKYFNPYDVQSFRIPFKEWRTYYDLYGETSPIPTDCISLLIQAHNIPIPFPNLTPLQKKRNFGTLQKISLSMLLTEGKWQHRRDIDWDENPFHYRPLMINRKRAGSRVAQSFHANMRAKVEIGIRPSMESYWNTPCMLRRGLHSMRSRKKPMDVSWNLVYHSFRLFSDMASHFRPSVAKAIFEMYTPRSVYDFSSGWGDRFLGALASSSVCFYHANDPNTDLLQIYNDMWTSLPHRKEYTLHPFKYIFTNECAEEYIPNNAQYDMVFTSPPYFNVEKYICSSSALTEKQCWKRYHSFEEWIDNFLQPAVKNAWSVLAPHGHLVLNIGDFAESNDLIDVQSVVHRILTSLPNSTDCGALGMQLHSRPNSTWKKRDVAVAYAEPIWVFQKRSEDTN
jgi:hypothetical protein